MNGTKFIIFTLTVPTLQLFTRDQFWPPGIVVACVCPCVSVYVRQSLACPCDNSSPIDARITKFGQEVQNNLVVAKIVFDGNCPDLQGQNELKIEIYPIFSYSMQ